MYHKPGRQGDRVRPFLNERWLAKQQGYTSLVENKQNPEESWAKMSPEAQDPAPCSWGCKSRGLGTCTGWEFFLSSSHENTQKGEVWKAVFKSRDARYSMEKLASHIVVPMYGVWWVLDLRGDHSPNYINVYPLWCTSETNMMLNVKSNWKK